jgi:glycosyltransferase involved in cell wall biosynthesis
MKKRSRVAAILPAYNAEKTVRSVLRSLPKGVFDDIIVSDDCSVDKTLDCIDGISHIIRLRTPRNLGYGGNLKYCLSTALELGADIVVEIHPDGEYGTDGIIPAVQKINEGAYLVLGNRFLAKCNGMYLWKKVGTKILSFIDNLLLGRVQNSIPDLHQGFRVYTRKLLETVNYRCGSNDYLFSFQIIALAARRGFHITSVPVSSIYSGNKRGASLSASIRYSWGTYIVLFEYYISKLGFPIALFAKNNDKQLRSCPTCRNSFLVRKMYTKKKQIVYFCDGCQNGFTYPAPLNMSPWYRQEYYNVAGVVGRVKDYVYRMFQNRRMLWVKRYLQRGSIVDVGSGEGEFGKMFGKNHSVTGIEAPFAHIINDKIIRTNYLSWKPEVPADAVVFWESLEHVNDPNTYLKHTKTILKHGGLVFIEYPRLNSLESRLFGRRWYHADIPRHQSQLSDAGISYLLRASGFHILYTHAIWAPEYAVIGLAASLLGFTADALVGTIHNPLFFVLFIPMLIISFLLESVLFLIGESPIGLVVAGKI